MTFGVVISLSLNTTQNDTEVKKYTSVLEIFWADYSKDEAQNEVVIGHSKNSESCAIDIICYINYL